MKKISIVGIIALFAIVLASAAGAAEWEKEVIKQPGTKKYESYTMLDENKQCTVILGEDGLVIIAAIDSSHDDYILTQTAEINAHGKVLFNRTQVEIPTKDEFGVNQVYKKEILRPVFFEKCMADTKTLPPKVREKLRDLGISE